MEEQRILNYYNENYIYIEIIVMNIMKANYILHPVRIL